MHPRANPFNAGEPMTKPFQTEPELFAPPGSAADREQRPIFQPKFDVDGLIPVIVTQATSGQVLMFAWMNAEALALTIETRLGHFYSRSRGKLWKKGEESGNLLQIVEMRVDCDQDVIAIAATVAGAGVACHTGARSCFYRTVPLGRRPIPGLALTTDQPVVK